LRKGAADCESAIPSHATNDESVAAPTALQSRSTSIRQPSSNYGKFIVHVAPDKKDGLVFVAIRSEGLEVTPSLIDGANTFRHKQGMMFHSPRSHDRPASSHNKKHSRQRPSMGPPHPTTMSRTTSTAAAEGSRYG